MINLLSDISNLHDWDHAVLLQMSHKLASMCWRCEDVYSFTNLVGGFPEVKLQNGGPGIMVKLIFDNSLHDRRFHLVYTR